MKHKALVSSSLLALAVAAGATTAKADTCNGFTNNLVSNCGFETGSFSSWSGTATTAMPQYAGIDTVDPFTTAHTPYSGTYEAYLANLGSDITLTQTLATTVGRLYIIDFALLNDTSPATNYTNDFAALFGGTTIFSESAVNAGSYTLYSLIGSANSTSTPLSFVSRNDVGAFELDSVSVTATTPEPSSLALLGTGALGLLTTAVRRRQRGC